MYQISDPHTDHKNTHNIFYLSIYLLERRVKFAIEHINYRS